MRCEDVRDDLPELVLGALPEPAAREVREHLAWCAGCRKEARELGEGAEVLAVAAGEADPPPGLEDRVVAAVGSAAGSRSRGRRSLVAAVAAALVAVVAVGWGAAMAGRATRLSDEAEIARRAAAEAAREFGILLEELSGEAVREASLTSGTMSPAGGRAVVFDSDVAGESDWALVVVGGLDEERGPYRAVLRGGDDPLRIGRLWPSAEGRLAAYALFDGLPPGSTDVAVLDADGVVALQGPLRSR